MSHGAAVECVDAGRLLQLESVIERGLTTFVEVGKALLEIRNARLYRATHSTWEAYCRERWQWSRQRANQQIAAAEVAGILTTTVVSPVSERVARELAPLKGEPEKVRDAWDSILQQHGPEPTAAEVREVVRSGMDVHYSSTTDNWATPQELFDVLDKEFHFTLDVCASPANAKAARYFTEADNGTGAVVDRLLLDESALPRSMSNPARAKPSAIPCEVEHKCDNDAPTTGNVFIEFEQKGRPSGIATTKADWWALEVQDDVWFIVRTSILRKAVERAKKLNKVTMGGDFNLYRGALVPIEWLYRGIPE